MRAFLLLVIGASSALAAAASTDAHAFDSNQFCQAVNQLVRAAAGDVGTWVDRTTRNDGVEIACDRKLVHFKRSSSAPVGTLRGSWREAKTREWQGAYCASPIWREAVDNGWLISTTVTTTTGERIWFACAKGGQGFSRVLPP
jgi:hypothetical protein